MTMTRPNSGNLVVVVVVVGLDLAIYHQTAIHSSDNNRGNISTYSIIGLEWLKRNVGLKAYLPNNLVINGTGGKLPYAYGKLAGLYSILALE